MKKIKKKILNPSYSTYHGRVRIPFIPLNIPISLGKGIYMDSSCPGCVILGNKIKNEKD